MGCSRRFGTEWSNHRSDHSGTVADFLAWRVGNPERCGWPECSTASVDWKRMGPPIDLRPVFPLERASLLGLLCTLDSRDWHRATVCPGWDVHDIVGHLFNDYVRRLSTLDTEHAMSGPPAGEDLPTYIARINEEFVVATRVFSPRLLIDMLRRLGPQLDAMWAECDPTEIGRIDVSWAAPGDPAPVWLDIAREYTEFWAHQQQIRDAVGRPGATEQRLLHPVLDTFLRALPYALRDASAAVGATVRVRVPGDAGGEWTATRDSQGWKLAADSGRIPTADVEIDARTLWRLATRGIEPPEAEATARVRGDRSLAATALTLLAIIR
jgi:uncharacterized protein (TIGR03083 family)